MLLKNIRNKLLFEFEEVSRGRNPRITKDVEAVVILSGDSGDPAIKTKIHDTEQRTLFGIKLFKKISSLNRKVVLILSGTKPQLDIMMNLSRINRIEKMKPIPTKAFPKASTLTQIHDLMRLPYRKIAFVTHAYHGPRTLRYIKKFYPEGEAQLFLFDRNKITKQKVTEEIRKISKYFK